MTGKSRNYQTTERKGPAGNSWDDPCFEMLLTAEDNALFEEMGEHFRALSDVKDVKNDPGYQAVNEIAKEMIAGYGKDPLRKIENEKFICDSISEERMDTDLADEISQIKNEINQSNLSELSSDWVKEWNDREQNSQGDVKTIEIQDFIARSIGHGET